MGEVASVAVPSVPPSLDTQSTSYDVIVSPKSSGASKLTHARESPGFTVGGSGVPGIVVGEKSSDSSRIGPSPRELVANSVHLYVLPLSRPSTSTGAVSLVTTFGVPPSDEVHDAV